MREIYIHQGSNVRSNVRIPVHGSHGFHITFSYRRYRFSDTFFPFPSFQIGDLDIGKLIYKLLQVSNFAEVGSKMKYLRRKI